MAQARHRAPYGTVLASVYCYLLDTTIPAPLGYALLCAKTSGGCSLSFGYTPTHDQKNQFLLAMNINEQTREIQEKWLAQRGWKPRGPWWVHPDSGITYGLSNALQIAQSEARLPADLELKVESPSRTDVTMTSFGTTTFTK